MKTYNDLAELTTEQDRTAFILAAIAEHKTSELYRIARRAELYYRHENPTIMAAQKLLYDFMGRAVPDIYSANNKIPCRYYFYFVTQLVQFLMGNGVSFGDEKTKPALGGTSFDIAIQDLATKAQNGGVSFGFWNADHLEAFGLAGVDEPSFVPLYDETTGMLRAGIRYWQIDSSKPLRCTLYEEDGFTEYMKAEDSVELAIQQEKRGYIQVVETSEIGGENVISDRNYPGFPIIPFYNINKQSELLGSQGVIDAYDLMASTMINNIDDGNIIYWILKNCGDMDDVDDAKFLEQIRRTHVAHPGDGNGEVDAHTVEAPFAANETALDRLRTQMFDDFMALDVRGIAGGAATATQIKAAYEPLNAKADKFEQQATTFILGLLRLLGIEDAPTYTRSMIVNKQEEITNVLAASQYLSDEYVTSKILEVNGDIDKLAEVQEQKAAAEVGRYPLEDIEEEAEV